MIRSTVPILHVRRIEAAEAFYCGLLGFRVAFSVPVHDDRPDPGYLGLTRDGVELHVSSYPGDGVGWGAAYFRVEDVDALHAEFVAKGAPIPDEPADTTWGTRELYVRDPDGNSLRFGQSSAD